MSKQAGDLPISRGLSGGVESKQRKYVPEKSTQNNTANSDTFWLLEEIETLFEILKSRKKRGAHLIVWKSVKKEFNRRFKGRLQEKGSLKKDGKYKLLEARFAPKRSAASIQALCQTEPCLKSVIEAYKNRKIEPDSSMDEDLIQSIQVEVFEGGQSPPRMFEWKGIRYIDNNDRTEAKVPLPDESKTIIEYISLLNEPKQDNAEHFKLGRFRFEYKPKVDWTLRNSVHMDEPSLRDGDVSRVDFSSVTKEFNDTLGVYRTKTQIKKLVADNDPRELKDDYMMEQNERKREIEVTNATAAAYAFSAKKLRISSFDEDQ
ncbi:uncharacterized protein EAE97_011845 [Botrytis byssoidea]|uniref:Uncharacterized protein n=1 Tax=Botrytis byssoidea TaxID=139641 RepID=A0A9P5HX03_9HELO|nr:uncharacterized protein EAE97_011845 [Botrytis byssoidea]KAF7918750.1 hypothetical protein EAE97_011845 [Botrytis byssoidea]